MFVQGVNCHRPLFFLRVQHAVFFFVNTHVVLRRPRAVAVVFVADWTVVVLIALRMEDDADPTTFATHLLVDHHPRSEANVNAAMATNKPWKYDSVSSLIFISTLSACRR